MKYDEQEVFWAEEYAEEYIKKNSSFDNDLGAKAWKKMLKVTNKSNLSNFLECGCNIGRNIEQLRIAFPNLKPSVVDISKPAIEFVTNKYDIDQYFHGSILDSDFDPKSFDLVFTMGVLIHINPSQLLSVMDKIYNFSRSYILIGEYFNRVPISLEYQGQKDKLFKRDFGRFFIDNFDVKLLDYGFLWGYEYDTAGSDDITWWLFERL